MIRSAAVVVAVTLQRLVSDPDRDWSVEEALVLDALRRSATRLNAATDRELSAYVAALDPDQLRGVVANVKGIYHELLFVHAENIDADAVTARVMEATNHPGADVEFVVEGEVIRVVQLKAVAAPEAILEHLARYPGIEVLATVEVAGAAGVGDSGFSNAALTGDVDRVVRDLSRDTLRAALVEGAATSGLVSAAIAAAQMLRGGPGDRDRVARICADLGLGVVTATALDVLLDGVV